MIEIFIALIEVFILLILLFVIHLLLSLVEGPNSIAKKSDVEILYSKLQKTKSDLAEARRENDNNKVELNKLIGKIIDMQKRVESIDEPIY